MATLKNTNIDDTGYLQLPALKDGGANNIYAMGGVTLSNSGRGLGVARNGLQLYIPTNAWERYQNLPDVLEGLITTLSINDASNITMTFDDNATVYLLRQPTWSAVDTSGWTQLWDNYTYASVITGYNSDWDLYKREFAAGTYNFDNNSAMYFISIGIEGELRYNEGIDSIQMFYKPNPSEFGRWQNMRIPFEIRQIITTNYVMGGYKSSVAWSNVNRCHDATDTTVNLGDGRIRAFNYQPGANSRDTAFVFGAGGGHSVSSNYVSAFNMRTETNKAHSNTWDLARSDHNMGSLVQEQRRAWANNAGTFQFFDLITETAGSDVGASGASNTWGMNTETYGILYGDTHRNFTFATSSIATRGGTQPGNSHQQKTVNSKWHYSWAGNEGSYSGGYNLRRTNFLTNSTSGTVGKPVGNSGEDNHGMGQHHQYMLGMYNGLQNNISWRWNYIAESGFQGGSSMEPKGHDGMSSAWNSWRD
jgi:hypothetical protein